MHHLEIAPHFKRVLACALFSIGLLQAAPTLGDVKWFNAADDDVPEFKQAKQIVIYFHASWCGYCKKLEENVLPTDGFQALGDQAMFIMVDDEHDERSNRETLEKNLNVESYPTLIVLKRDGEKMAEVGRIVGLHPADEYLALLRPLLGAKNPADAALPDSLTGSGLTPNSNLCQPGDFKCLVGESKLSGKPFTSFEDILKATPTPMPAPAEQGLTDETLAAMIKDLGFSPEIIPSTADSRTVRFIQEEDGWKFPTDAALSSNKNYLWLTLSFGQSRPTSELPSDKLVKLLEYNNSYGPTHFTIANGYLQITRPLTNAGITKDSLAYALSELRRATRETSDVWSSLTQAAAAK